MLMQDPAAACPAKANVHTTDLFLPNQCGDDLEITEVLTEGHQETLTGEDGTERPACCYTVEVEDSAPNSSCAVGRPYRERGVRRAAPLLSAGSEPDGASERALAWARAGAEEHASVAAFARLALQLMAHGAPSELLRAVQQAALDEIGHAERCWAMARHFGSSVSQAGPFPFTEAPDVNVTLADLAADAVREGCLGETLGAELVRAAAGLAQEPAVKATLSAIAAEEAEHAVLSYRIVAWALRIGGAEVRSAVREACLTPWPAPDFGELALRAGVDRQALRRAVDDGIRELLEPAMARLLAA
jgi:hypothetical protein